MPGKRCSVVSCQNSIYKTNNIEDKTIMYHRFPKDENVRKQWIYNTGKESLFNADHGWVCSEHFSEDDYERDLMAELLKIPAKRRLKASAVPTKHLPIKKNIVKEVKKRKVEFANQLELTPNEDQIIETLNTSEKSLNTPGILKHRGRPPKKPCLEEIYCEVQIKEDGSIIKQEIVEIESSEKKLENESTNKIIEEQNEIQRLKTEYEKLIKQNESLLLMNKSLENELIQEKNDKQKQQIMIKKEIEAFETKNQDLYELLKKQAEAKKEQKDLGKHNDELDEQIKTLKCTDNKNKKLISNLEYRIKSSEQSNDNCMDRLKDTFTQNQIDILLQRKTKVPWTAEEITQANTIRYYSKRCYNYLRHKLNYPLPGLTTLKHWTSNSYLKQGFFTDIFDILKDEAKTFSETDKIIVLQYNKVYGTCENDQINDKVSRAYSHIEVVQAYGLFSEWKHIIYVDFEKPFTSNELINIVQQFTSENFRVIAIVGDCNAKKLWQSLEISENKSWFLNPSTQEKIYFFVDVSHLLKLLRNWFIDIGFSWDSGKKVTIEHIETLLYMNCNGLLNDNFHLNTKKHIHCQGAQRRIVDLAKDIFSHETADAIRKNLPDDTQVVATANFIELVRNWYDIFDCDVPNVINSPFKSAFGLYLEEQTKVLEDMFFEISHMRCGNRENNMFFQKAILLSINSLFLIQKECLEKYNIDCIITKKLKQDTLEQLYNTIKTYDQHESGVNCFDKLKMVIMGKIPEYVKKNSIHSNPPIVRNKVNKIKTVQPTRIALGPNKLPIIAPKNQSITFISSTPIPKKDLMLCMVNGQYILQENENVSDGNISENNINENDAENIEESNNIVETNLDETIDESIQENDENVLTIDSNSNEEVSEEDMIAKVLHSAGINVDSMEPGQIIEVVFQSDDESDSSVHDVQFVYEV